jgi:hypothetical protein
MAKKALVTILLAVLAIFALPTAANAAGYTAQGSSATISAGGVATLTFSGFDAGESTTASAPDAVTLGAVKVVSTASKNANSEGVVQYTASATKPGTYTITVVGASGKTAIGTLTVVPASAGAGSGNNDGALPNTGLETNMLVIWGAAGVLALGIALVSVLTIARRRNANV